MNYIKNLHKISGKPSTKLWAGTICFLAFIAVGLFGVITPWQNNHVSEVLRAFGLMTAALYGIGSVDVATIYSKKNGKDGK